ncbi:MAG: type II secretion system protein [Butyrivibrio sp.]|nr:type II secretion system protein [Butyrivibrio sp.]
MKDKRKGFTLAELLIVVAIIAVLVAVAIPVFTAQLNKAKFATDLANARAQYAVISADYLANGEITYQNYVDGQACGMGTTKGYPITNELRDADGNVVEKFEFNGMFTMDMGYCGNSIGMIIYANDCDYLDENFVLGEGNEF